MASDNRAAARRSSRAKASSNGKPKKPPEQPQEANGVFIVVDRAPDGANIAGVSSVGMGDVRPAEIPTILETALMVARRNLGFEA